MKLTLKHATSLSDSIPDSQVPPDVKIITRLLSTLSFIYVLPEGRFFVTPDQLVKNKAVLLHQNIQHPVRSFLCHLVYGNFYQSAAQPFIYCKSRRAPTHTQSANWLIFCRTVGSRLDANKRLRRGLASSVILTICRYYRLTRGRKDVNMTAKPNTIRLAYKGTSASRIPPRHRYHLYSRIIITTPSL